MYCEDHDGYMPPNQHGAGSGGWVIGWITFIPNMPDNTNILKLVGTRKQLGPGLVPPKLGPYSSAPGIYKCPADTYNCKMGKKMLPRVRSNSMNGFIEGGAYGTGGQGQRSARGATWYSGHKPYNKLGDITGKDEAGLYGGGVTSPTELWVFVDEHPDSINDGWHISPPGNDASWDDLPASYHNGGCSYSFADNHAEIKIWKDKVPRSEPVLRSSRNGFPNYDPTGKRRGYNDYWWVIERSTSKL